jgi:hypothetical protein
MRWAAVSAGLIFLVACGRHEDYVLAMQLSGHVRDENGIGVGGVKVFFEDLGLDDTKRGRRFVAETDATGAITQRLDYRFGRTYWFRRPSRGEPFSLSFEKEGMQASTRRYDGSSLPEKDGVKTLGVDVTLQSRSSRGP